MTEHTSTEPLEPPLAQVTATAGWGAPVWGAAAPHPSETTAMDDDEPFVPAPRYRMGRFTKALVCVCLVLAGALGGAAIQKAADVRTGATNRATFSQFTGAGQNGAGTGQNGAGTGQNGTGGFGRNRAGQGSGAGAGGTGGTGGSR